jgi:hypothetical protein
VLTRAIPPGTGSGRASISTRTEPPGIYPKPLHMVRTTVSTSTTIIVRRWTHDICEHDRYSLGKLPPGLRVVNNTNGNENALKQYDRLF